jgi:predicted transcriptional regulator of viral defense system
MKWQDLLFTVKDEPIFTTAFLAAGGNLSQIRLQLGRWVKDGRLIKVHKGLYTLAEPYRKVKAEPFYIANNLKSPSYVSLQSALAWYGLIPEFVPAITSVTSARPQTIETPMGRFYFRHIDKNLFWGYQQVELSSGQTAFVARPEKALIDLVYLTAEGDKKEFLEELRLQNLEVIDKAVFRQFVEKTESPKLNRALKTIEKIINEAKGNEL